MNNGQRFLPRGAIFEASSKLERVSLPDRHVAGLIKLSDESGWAMVPTADELKLQYQQMLHKSGFVIDEVTVGTTGTGAVEEVGNAVIVTTESALDDSKRVFLRIVPRNGVVVSCPPTGSNVHQAKPSRPQSVANSSATVHANAGFGCIGGKYNTEVCGKSSYSAAQSSSHDDKYAPSRRGVFPNHPALIISPSVIPCGLVVEVEPWEENSAEVLKPVSSDAPQSVSNREILSQHLSLIFIQRSMAYLWSATLFCSLLHSNILCVLRQVDGSRGISTVNQSISESKPFLKYAVDHFGSEYCQRTG